MSQDRSQSIHRAIDLSDLLCLLNGYERYGAGWVAETGCSFASRSGARPRSSEERVS